MSSNPYSTPTSPREGNFTDRPPAGAAPGVIPEPGPRPPEGGEGASYRRVGPAESATDASGAADSADAATNPAAKAFARLSQDVAELKEYAGHYLTAKVDGVKRTVKNVGLYAAVGVLGLIAGGAIVATAAGLIIVGVAQLLGDLFDRQWLGNLVAGLLVLTLIGVGVWLMMKKLTGSWRAQTVQKYEQRKQSQRDRFGHDVDDRATEQSRAVEQAQRRQDA
jgi:hypothetical protein